MSCCHNTGTSVDLQHQGTRKGIEKGQTLEYRACGSSQERQEKRREKTDKKTREIEGGVKWESEREEIRERRKREGEEN